MKFKDQTNQKVHQWQFAKTTKQLEYKGGYAGVPFDTGSEVDTSATCCLCGIKEKGRVKRGLYRCKKYHVQFNADGLGAINISKRYRRIPLRKPSGIGVVGALASPVVVLWDNHRWVPQDEANLQTVRNPRFFKPGRTSVELGQRTRTDPLTGCPGRKNGEEVDIGWIAYSHPAPSARKGT